MKTNTPSLKDVPTGKIPTDIREKLLHIFRDPNDQKFKTIDHKWKGKPERWGVVGLTEAEIEELRHCLQTAPKKEEV